MPEYVSRPGGAVDERDKVDTPRRFRVLLLNDDYTTTDFVVMVLEEVFHRRGQEAERIMWHVHENGKGVAGVYIRAVAEMKVKETHALAKEYGFPLRCGLEPDA